MFFDYIFFLIVYSYESQSAGKAKLSDLKLNELSVGQGISGLEVTERLQNCRTMVFGRCQWAVLGATTTQYEHSLKSLALDASGDAFSRFRFRLI